MALNFEDLRDAPAPLILKPAFKGFLWFFLILAIVLLADYYIFANPFDNSSAKAQEIFGNDLILLNIFIPIFLGIPVLVILLVLFFGRERLILYNDHFIYFSAFGKKIYLWKETSSFSEHLSVLRYTLPIYYLSFNCNGEEKRLDNVYRLTISDFAKLMNSWRERAIKHS